MATLGSIRAELIADSTKWGKGLKESKSGLTSFKTAALGTFAAITAAGVAAATIFTTKVLPQFDKLDEVAKLSRSTGFGTEDLLAYQFGAEQSGVATEKLNKGLQRFTRISGEAKAGSSAAIAGFNGLGISVKQLAGLSLDEQLLLTAERIKQIPDPAEKAAAAYKLFGRQGQELLNFLNEGADGLQRFKDEAGGLGLLFSADELAKIEAANDAMNRLDRSVEAMWQQIAVEAAPAVETLADQLTTMLQETDTKPLIEGFGALAEVLLQVADKAGKAYNALRDITTDEVAPILKLAELTGLVPEGTTDEFRDMRDGADEARDAVERIPKQIDPLKAMLDVDAAGLAKVQAMMEQVQSRIDQLKNGTADWEIEFQKLARATGLPKEDLRELHSLLEQREQLEQKQRRDKELARERERAAEAKIAEAKSKEARRKSLADSIRDRNQTPLQELQAGIGKLFETKDLLSDQTKSLELERLRDVFLDAVKPDDDTNDEPTQFAAAAARGSSAAASAVAAAIAQSQTGSDTQTVAQQQLGLTKEQSMLIGQVNQELAMLNGKVPNNTKLVPVESLDG